MTKIVLINNLLLMFVGIGAQAVPPVFVLFLKNQLHHKAGAGGVAARRQPLKGNHFGWWQRERDFHLIGSAWIQRGQSWAAGRPPPLASKKLNKSIK